MKVRDIESLQRYLSPIVIDYESSLTFLLYCPLPESRSRIKIVYGKDREQAIGEDRVG